MTRLPALYRLLTGYPVSARELLVDEIRVRQAKHLPVRKQQEALRRVTEEELRNAR